MSCITIINRNACSVLRSASDIYRHTIRLKVMLWTILCALPNHTLAQNNELDIDSLVRVVMTTEGEPTRSTYQSFWNYLNDQSGSEAASRKLVTMLQGQLGLAMELQAEGWKSVKISYQSEEAVETVRYRELEEESYPEFKRSAKAVMTETEYQQFMATFQPGWEGGRRNFAILLDSASKRETALISGEEIPLSAEYIDLVLSSVEPGFERISRLLTPPAQ